MTGSARGRHGKAGGQGQQARRRQVLKFTTGRVKVTAEIGTESCGLGARGRPSEVQIDYGSHIGEALNES